MEFDYRHDRGRGLLLQPLRLKNGYVATLCDRKNCATLREPKQIWCDFARPKKGMLRPLQLKMGMLWLCATKKFARLCANQNRYDATLRDPKQISCDFGRLTQRFAFLRNSKTLKYILYKYMNVCMYVCMFYGVWLPPGLRSGLLLQPLRLKMGMLRLCVTKIIARFYAT